MQRKKILITAVLFSIGIATMLSVTSEYGYDDIGRLEMTVVTSGEVSDTTLRSYNVRGWQTEIQNDSWSAQMRYNNPLLSGSVASFTGNISEWEWTRGNSTDTYSLEYDALSRIVDSRLFRNGNPVDALSESGISYDSNGNILSLTRTGEDGYAVNDLSYHYDGNRLTSLSDGDIQFQNYAYDADGNMTFDGRTGMSLEWNDLGLVEKVSLNGENLVNYAYLADGTKVSALDGDGDGLLYLGSLIYRKTGSNISLESAGFAGGRFVARETEDDGKAMVPMFHVTDHLGSVRAVVDGISGAVVETNDYYPFGSRWNTTAGLTDQANRFRYNSKEEQFRFGTPYIDYGARQYDPLLGRWFAQDPLSEKYYSISPYAFCAGNPVKYLDPDGRKVLPKGANELLMIKHTIPSDMREYIQVGTDGLIDKNLINSATAGVSSNFISLQIMVNSPIIVEVVLNDKFIFHDSNGNIGEASMSYTPYDSNYPEDRDLKFENISGLSTGEMGFSGKTLFPDNIGQQNSPNGNIVIIINSSLSPLGAAETFSHEGYGHALLYILNGGDHNGASHMPISSENGPIDVNSVLRDMILSARKETVENFN